MAEVMPGFEQIDSAVNLYPEVKWNGGFVAHQRALKMLENQTHMGAHFSAGAGKSALFLGAFTHLHSQGKVQRSLVAVPSGIIGQIVGECATFLEPGKYNYSANMGWDREKRLEALKDPSMSLHFTTRESLANDLLHLVEKHTGVNPDDFQDTKARSEGDRRALMLTALQNEGIDPKSLLFTVDEAHDLARRKGVAPSKRSLALDALAHHSAYHIAGTGTAMKNDVSEIGDFLQKVGALEAEDMAGFMARYGKNTQANTRALQRIMAKYSYAIAVKPTTKDGQDLSMRHEKPRIPLTEYQKTGRSALLGHYETVKSWKDRELSKAMAAKVARGDHSPLNGADLAHAWDDPGVRDAIAAMAPDDYSSMSDEAKQQAIGGQVLGASAMKFTALNRLYHRAPYEHNAKAQHLVSAAKDAVKAGKPGVVFCASSESAKMLRDEMAKEGLRVGYVDGSFSSEQKSKERLRFSPGKGVEPETDILVVTDAMQTGANLQRGKVLWHFDIPLTQKAFDQRSARIYRRGQTEDVEVNTLMADAPEDEIALARMERKAVDSSIFQGYSATLGHSEVLDDSGLSLAIAQHRAALPQAA
jgi:superfamily II DNA or RNA helicase